MLVRLIGKLFFAVIFLPIGVLLNAQEQGLLQLTHDGNTDQYPIWSPNGQSIAFASYPGGQNPDLWEVSPSGNNLQQLTTGTHGYYVAASKILLGSDRAAICLCWIRSSSGSGTDSLFPRILRYRSIMLSQTEANRTSSNCFSSRRTRRTVARGFSRWHECSVGRSYLGCWAMPVTHRSSHCAGEHTRRARQQHLRTDHCILQSQLLSCQH